ncbi:MrcB family domain-containing protein [Sutcliffiella horikoshii]|uniref:MrcB family domain-containing protein n=1 Tax=Sutcliffiella horikoshii TaxID=79883 RepID=UPI003CE69C4B
MLTKILLELLNKVNTINTLTSNRPNKIVRTDSNGIYVESEASRRKFENNEATDPHAYIPFEFLTTAWEEFIQQRMVSASDFTKTRGRSSFIMALFAKLPYVKVIKEPAGTKIKLKEFKTDQLPCEQFHKVIRFLDQVTEGTYDPPALSKQAKNDNEYRILSRARQDLRLLGLLNNANQISERFHTYEASLDKSAFIRDLVLEKEYFQIALFVLQLLEAYPKNEKKVALIELGMLIVRNSQGENLMVESVAKERTHNLLMWLEKLEVIDSNWAPIEEITLEENTVSTRLRDQFLHIMNNYPQAKSQPFGGHELGSFVRNDITDELKKLPFVNGQYVVTGSVGQGNWASVPWIAIMNKKVTISTQRGYYIGYLFSEDLQELYLTFAQGVTETSKEEMLRIKEAIRSEIGMDDRFQKDDNIYLGPSKRARDYAVSTAVYVKYKLENFPSEEIIVGDLEKMVRYYEEFVTLNEGVNYIPTDPPKVVAMPKADYMSNQALVEHIYQYIKSKGFFYEKNEITNLFLSLKTKPFVIISGISGTGKTKIIEWFAESVGANEENGQFTLIPVRPDWSDGSDLIGYKDIKGDFVEGPLTKVMQKTLNNPTKPHFVLLDEMNLARVEYYFSDLLSVMESRNWKDGEIVSSEILDSSMVGRSIGFPENMYIVGTVNMDETTHPFSKKVLDRAITIEFNRVQLDYLDFLEGTFVEVQAKNIENSMLRADYLYLKDLASKHMELIKETSLTLVHINEALKQLGAQVGYRVRDEICMYLAYNQEGKLFPQEDAFDYCLVQKILPRISGSASRVEHTIKELFKLLTNQELSEDIEDYTAYIKVSKYPRSTEKLVEMYRRLTHDGFTSFWIS